jgi:hypothetical protein
MYQSLKLDLSSFHSHFINKTAGTTSVQFVLVVPASLTSKQTFIVFQFYGPFFLLMVLSPAFKPLIFAKY